ncbi:48fe3794-8a3f-4231-9560-e9d9663a37f0 [Thermothielavioides terrestris]|uniref:48fe3794-8a3f-4231-9560-e9d9663a37f0 n=1 Tax=Thermothielavioides terrestris TaxID=2587410 RepID=A0A3S4ARR4_9PEZI|nr:48fe3794-8a3f-4231-9560-e9d9663a37f0 [Thermothielavioides terrestris]
MGHHIGSAPNPPSEEEREFYYLGLDYDARLLARTSSLSLPWSFRHWPWDEQNWQPQGKRFFHLGGHPIAAAWPAALKAAVVAVLNERNFSPTFVEPVRIGFASSPGPAGRRRRGDAFAPPSPTSSAVVLLVGVAPLSLSWREGMDMARCCRRVLERAGIGDVEVEVQETNAKFPVGVPSRPRVRRRASGQPKQDGRFLYFYLPANKL